MGNITNSSPIVTEDKLKDFYEDIKPFLGCPAYLTSEGTSDYYSTDEKVVGRWVDGKPIYQKSYVTSPFTVTTTSQLITLENNFLNKKIIGFNGFMDWNNEGTQRMIPFPNVVGTNNWIDVQLQVNDYSASDIKLELLYWRASGSTPNTVARITVQYIKTTDSAATTIQEDPNEYSTDEKIIGKWIDGKPIYQKTVNCGTLPNNSTKTVSLSISNVKNIISSDGIALTSDGSIVLPHTDLSTNDSVQLYFGGDNVVFRTKNDYSGYTAYLTVRYLKTTD